MKVIHYDKVRKVEGHDCPLPQDEELINLYISGGILVDFRRKLRQFLMVSASNYETKSMLKSSSQIRSEESRHLRNHYFIIHPFSEMRVIWEKIMIVVYFGHFMLMPLVMALPVTRDLLRLTKTICDVLSWIDIVLFFFTGQVIQVYRRNSNSKNKYNNLIQEIGEYMTYKELPTPLRNKVVRYVEFKFQKNIFKEGDILLSKILKQDVVLHNCKRMVERVDFFKGLPNNLILRIVTKLRSEIYLPNDMIVQGGVPGNAMYFIYMSTVAVYTITGREICHLEDGSHFGEIALVINEPRVASVVAVTDCEVFRLSRKDFLEAVEPYPSLCNKIKNSALSRLKDTRKVMETASEVEQNVFFPSRY